MVDFSNEFQIGRECQGSSRFPINIYWIKSVGKHVFKFWLTFVQREHFVSYKNFVKNLKLFYLYDFGEYYVSFGLFIICLEPLVILKCWDGRKTWARPCTRKLDLLETLYLIVFFPFQSKMGFRCCLVLNVWVGWGF